MYGGNSGAAAADSAGAVSAGAAALASSAFSASCPNARVRRWRSAITSAKPSSPCQLARHKYVDRCFKPMPSLPLQMP